MATAEDPKALLAEVVARLREKVSIWATAEQFNVEDVIDPRETRQVLYRWLDAATRSQQAGPKHGPQCRP